MAFWPFLHFFIFCTYLYLSLYVVVKNPRSLLGRVFSLYIISFAIWSLGKVFVHSPGATIQTATLFENISSIGWISFGSFFLLFALVFCEKTQIVRSKFSFLIFLPTIVFLYLQWSGKELCTHVPQPYGWGNLWVDSFWTVLFYLYYLSFMLTGLILVAICGNKTKILAKKKQSTIIITTTFLALCLGTLTDVILPELNIYSIPDIADVLSIIFALGVVFAMFKYEFLAITPQVAADRIISKMSDSLILLDASGAIKFINEATAQLLKYKKRELVGRDMNLILSSESVGKLKMIGREFTEVIENSSLKNEELNYITRYGDDIPVLVSTSILRGNNKEMIGIIVFARDITPLKRAQDGMRILNERLKNKEKDALNIMAELRKINDELKTNQEKNIQVAKIDSLEKIMLDLAHELNNPLMIISGKAQLSLMDRIDNEEVKNNLISIKEQSERAKSIIDRLMMFSHPTKGEVKKININEAIDSALRFFDNNFAENNIRVNKSYDNFLPFINVDEKEMQEVFINILRNAAEAISANGVLNILTRMQDKKIRIDFEDNGIGMDKDKLFKVYDPFFTTKEDHLGLGTSICHGIIKAHKGEMLYNSEPGKGTTVTIYLPIN